MSHHTLLIVNANAAFRQRIRRDVEACRWSVLEAADSADALELAKRHVPDLILLEASPEGGDGDTVARTLKWDPVTCTIPIITLGGAEERSNHAEPWAADALAPSMTIPALAARRRQAKAAPTVRLGGG